MWMLIRILDLIEHCFDLKLSKSVRIDINLLYFVMIFLDFVM
jgi:hypothetical protein